MSNFNNYIKLPKDQLRIKFIVVVMLILGLLYLSIYIPTKNDINAMNKQIKKLQEIDIKLKNSEMETHYSDEIISRLTHKLDMEIKQIKSSLSPNFILTEISSLTDQSNVSLNNIKSGSSEHIENLNETLNLSSQTYVLNFSTSLQNLYILLGKIHQSKLSLLLDNLQISSNDNNNGLLDISMRISFYNIKDKS
ncbi:MAG: hypothetical protein COA79_02335 [Planctomycetota bacterium]|nr:MAG: hypothetical protein COA79_02335 [Planctomycetota bacterium]